jgi:hypothetical protein
LIVEERGCECERGAQEDAQEGGVHFAVGVVVVVVRDQERLTLDLGCGTLDSYRSQIDSQLGIIRCMHERTGISRDTEKPSRQRLSATAKST